MKEVYNAMQEGNIEKLKNLIKEGHTFVKSENGPDYDGPLQSLLKGYHCDLDKRKEMLDIMIENMTEEDLKNNKWMMLNYAGKETCKVFGMEIDQNLFEIADHISKKLKEIPEDIIAVNTKFDEIEDNKIALRMEFCVNNSSMSYVYDILGNIYWNNESESILSKGYSGSSAYGDRPVGSKMYYWNEGAWYQHVSVILYPGTYSFEKGTIKSVWKKGLKKEWTHPFDAQWDMFPNP